MNKVVKIDIKKMTKSCLSCSKNCFLKCIDVCKHLRKSILLFCQSKAGLVTKKSIIVLVILLALFETALGIMVYGLKVENKLTQNAAKIIPLPVAIANYSIVTLNDYIKEKEYIHHFYNSTEQEEADFKEIDKQIMDQLVDNKIVESQAKKHKVKVEKSDIDLAINGIVEQNGGQDKVKKVLDDLYGISLSDFRVLVKNQLLRDKLNDKVISKVTAKHILIRVDKDAAPETVNETKAKIDAIRAEIIGGVDFAESAKKNSEDVGSAEQGGQLEPFAKGEMVEEFSNSAFSTSVGSISEPVKTEFGWHIIKVEAKTGTVEQTFGDWMTELKEKNFILKFI